MAMFKKMESSPFLKGTGLGAIAAAIAMMAMPAGAMAQDGNWRGRQGQGQMGNPDGGPRWNRGQSATSTQQVQQQQAQQQQRVQQQRANRVEQRGDWQARRIDNRSENRAARVENQGDRAAAQAARQGNWNQARRIDQQSERQARQIERRGDWRANQVDRQSERRAEAIRDAQREQNRTSQNRTWQQRNGTYRDDDRNRTYRADRNPGWRANDSRNDNWRDNDRRGSSNRWSRTWRNDNRYDWQNYRARNRNVYRIDRYYAPYRNYSYRRVGIGFSLGALFYSNNYWISDPWQYRLPPAYGPYRWVRYYDDVLLVNTYSGEVVDVIHDFFW